MNNGNIFEALGELQTAFKDYYSSDPSKPFDLQAFSVWLFHREEVKIKSADDFIKENTNSHATHGSVDDQISFILLNIHKLIKFYVKKALDGTQLISIDDIHYLMYLTAFDSITKSELINSNISEMSSGIEVIKRLLKKELIEDFDDPGDKRSKRVKITAKGLEEIRKVTSKFQNLHKLLGSAVPQEDKFSLLATLSRIYNFHLNIFNNEKNASLEELFVKYLNQEAK